MVQSLRKNSARLSAGPCRIRLRAFRLHPSPPRPLPIAGSSGCVLSLAGFPAADPATRSPAGYGCGLFRLRPSPLRPLPTAGPSGCPSIPFGCGGGRQGRERGTTVCFTRDRLRRAAAVGSVWRKGGMTGGRRLPGLQGGLVRMAGGDCRGCKVRLVAWRAVFVGSARENPGRAGRRTRLRITGRHRVTVRSSHGGRPGGESSATRCAVDIFLLILPS